MFDTFAVVNYTLDTLDKYGYRVTNLKLQRILYFAYGIYLLIRDDENDKLFPSPIVAWRYGAVIKCVYEEFKNKVDDPITSERATLLKKDYDYTILIPNISEKNKLSRRCVEIACRVYGHHQAFTLINLINKKGSAWSKKYVEGESNEIDDESIKEEFMKYISLLVEYLEL